MTKAPTTRLGWFRYYAGRWGKTGNFDALHLAIWYWLLHIEKDAPHEMWELMEIT